MFFFAVARLVHFHDSPATPSFILAFQFARTRETQVRHKSIGLFASVLKGRLTRWPDLAEA